MVVVGMNGPAEQRRRAEQIEEVTADRAVPYRDRLRVRAEIPGPLSRADGAEVLERVCAGAPLLDVAVGHLGTRHKLVLAGDDEALLVGEGERTKENGVRDREERRRRGDAEAEQQHGEAREGRRRA